MSRDLFNKLHYFSHFTITTTRTLIRCRLLYSVHKHYKYMLCATMEKNVINAKFYSNFFRANGVTAFAWCAWTTCEGYGRMFSMLRKNAKRSSQILLFNIALEKVFRNAHITRIGSHHRIAANLRMCRWYCHCGLGTVCSTRENTNTNTWWMVVGPRQHRWLNHW